MWQDDLEFRHPFLFMRNLEDKYAPQELFLIHEALTLLNKNPNYVAMVKVAQVLVDQHVQADVLISFLLAPLLWERSIAFPAIRKRFGAKIASVLGHFSLQPFSKSGAQLLISSLSKYSHEAVLALAFLLVDLEHTIVNKNLPNRDKGEKVLRLFVPIASRLNLRVLRRSIEDTAFHVLDPPAYQKLLHEVTPASADDTECLELLKTALERLLKKHGIAGEIQGRVKSLYSIYCKMVHKGKSLSKISDKIGLRIIVQTVPMCYRVLGILHSQFQPISNYFKDYIGLPKNNGYQSLHTCVYPVRSMSYKPIEFQVRTHSMHSEAEYGASSHWQYKWKKQNHAGESDTTYIEFSTPSLDNKEKDLFFHLLNSLAYKETIVVFGATGKIIRLPENATVQHYIKRTQTAILQPDTIITVNGVTVDTDHPLVEGDSIEIISPVKETEGNKKEPVHKEVKQDANNLYLLYGVQQKRIIHDSPGRLNMRIS